MQLLKIQQRKSTSFKVYLLCLKKESSQFISDYALHFRKKEKKKRNKWRKVKKRRRKNKKHNQGKSKGKLKKN